MNRFFLTESGQSVLKESLKVGSYFIREPHNGILLCLAACSKPSDSDPILQQVESEFEYRRFYPDLGSHTYYQAPEESFHRWNVDQLRQSLWSYAGSKALQRQTESNQIWRPLYEEALQQVAQTVEETWPFQTYPDGWRQSAMSLCQRAAKLFAQPVLCHHPQRSESNLRVVLSALEKSLADPSSLSGREVGLCRRILLDSEARWGKLGSAERLSSRQLEGQQNCLLREQSERILSQVEHFDPAFGISAPILQGEDLPEPIIRRIEKSLQKTDSSKIPRHSLIAQQKAREVAESWENPAVGSLLGRLCLAYGKRCSKGMRESDFWNLPGVRLLKLLGFHND